MQGLGVYGKGKPDEDARYDLFAANVGKIMQAREQDARHLAPTS